ncbi:sulfurtransferase [Sulfuriferula plumbiphila]|uniref:Sulfurtransferase n=1 Tax=Sulfuriferula plumbiphila TaxID=171865 RepID=A0A512LBX4_9PROT|nr:rhodanese-like domain-containing protein [Sulfuriferula plumbiphila]BBP04694.1 sulfurtransferase [Sulfuriferula plumbiphila]GEP31882.1 sulfurtransferase [Sulfuriferula plumbiphila]
MQPDPVIEPSDLATMRSAVLLDVRDSAAFKLAHAPSAVRVPIEHWEAAARADETSLGNVAYWETAINALGVDNTVLAVVYDDGRMTEAARVWFILQYFGAKAVIVNGGWPAMLNHAVVPTGSPLASKAHNFQAQAGSGKVGLLDRDGLRAELGSTTRIFDARSAAEFDGGDRRKNARGGHLPGARHLAHSQLLDGQRLRPAHELQQLLTEAGFQAGDHVVTHCDGGGRAALAAVAAVRAGYTGVRAYYLSFADWARDESCPISRD